MVKPKKKGGSRPALIDAEVSSTTRHPNDARAILWDIAKDPGQSGTARVSACRLLLIDARERNDGEGRHDADINKRAAVLLRRVMAH